jgi:tetratricopeptide (TPR) repeat protein
MKKENYRWGERFPKGYSETAPVLHSSYYEDLTEREGFLFTYNYNTRTNANLATCKVPLYAKLFNPVAIPAPTRKVYKEIHYLNDFINFIKHPFSKISFGVFLAANLYTLLFAWQPQSIILSTIIKSVLLTPAPLIGLSVAYGTTLLFAYLSSVKIKTLTAKVDKIISEVKENDPDILVQRLYELEKQNPIFFSYWFPGNQALLFKYFFLHGLTAFKRSNFNQASNDFQRALDLSQNKKDEFICIRKIVDCIYKKYFRYNEESYKKYPEKVKEYIDQVPANSEFHAEITAKLEQGLKECYALIDEDKVTESYKKFAELEFDAFTDEFYPHLSIMYYQLEAALTLSGKRFEYDSNLFTRGEESITIARHSLLKAQWYIDTYYPEESVAHRQYVLEFEKFWALLPVVKHLHNPGLLGVYDGRRLKTVVIPVEKEIPNKHVKIEFEPLKLGM